MGNRWHVCCLDNLGLEVVFDTKEKAMQQIELYKKSKVNNLILFKEAGRVSVIAANLKRVTFDSNSDFKEYIKKLEKYYGSLQVHNINSYSAMHVGDVVSEVYDRNGEKIASIINNEVTCLQDLAFALSKYIKPELVRVDSIKVNNLHEITIPLALGLSNIQIDTISGVWNFEIIHSNGSKETSNTPDKAYTDVDSLLRRVNYVIEYYGKKFPYESHLKLDKIAGWIGELTGTKYDFAGEDNGSLTLDFNIGISYLKNKEGKGLYFALNTDTGKEIATVDLDDCNGSVNTFITRVAQVVNNRCTELKKKQATK